MDCCIFTGERNFHIFYDLLAGGDGALLNRLELEPNPMDYHYLSQVSESVYSSSTIRAAYIYIPIHVITR